MRLPAGGGMSRNWGGGRGGAILTGDNKGNGLEELRGGGGAIENDMANFAFF